MTEARSFLEAAQEHAREAGNTLHPTRLLPKLGQVVTRLGEEDQGNRYLLEGLHLAWQANDLPDTLHTLTPLAELEAERSDQKPATHYLQLVIEHPATKRKTHDTAHTLLQRIA